MFTRASQWRHAIAAAMRGPGPVASLCVLGSTERSRQQPIAFCKFDHQLDKGLPLRFQSLHDICSKYSTSSKQTHESAHVETAKKQIREAQEQNKKASQDFSAPFMVVVVGAFSAGKSTLINTLAAKKVCKTGVKPTTDSIDEIPMTRGRHKWCIVDSPGLDALERPDHKEKAIASARRANLAVLVMNARQPLRDSEVPILLELLQGDAMIVAALNFWNEMADEEKKESMEYVSKSLNELLGKDVLIVPMNAKDPNDEGVVNLRKHLDDQLGKSDVVHRQKCMSACAALRRDANTVHQALDALKQQHEQYTIEQVQLLDLSGLNTKRQSLEQTKWVKLQFVEREMKDIEEDIRRLKADKGYQPPSFWSNVRSGAANGLLADAATGGMTMGLGTLCGAIAGGLIGASEDSQREQERETIQGQLRERESRLGRLRTDRESLLSEQTSDFVLLDGQISDAKSKSKKLEDRLSRIIDDIVGDQRVLKEIMTMGKHSMP